MENFDAFSTERSKRNEFDKIARHLGISFDNATSFKVIFSDEFFKGINFIVLYHCKFDSLIELLNVVFGKLLNLLYNEGSQVPIDLLLWIWRQ